MSDEAPPPPSWLLISVLFSTFPMEEALALKLHRIAVDLYRGGEGLAVIDHELSHGHVKNARKDAAVGTITGPVFEAELETARGKGQVQFILTRQGLEAMSVHEARDGRPAYLN
jgi:hypothetical protein